MPIDKIKGAIAMTNQELPESEPFLLPFGFLGLPLPPCICEPAPEPIPAPDPEPTALEMLLADVIDSLRRENEDLEEQLAQISARFEENR